MCPITAAAREMLLYNDNERIYPSLPPEATQRLCGPKTGRRMCLLPLLNSCCAEAEVSVLPNEPNLSLAPERSQCKSGHERQLRNLRRISLRSTGMNTRRQATSAHGE